MTSNTSVPSVAWNEVIRAQGLSEYLCTTCIVREFVRVNRSFTATLWNEEFNGVPIEVVVNGQTAQDATAIQEENNTLRARIYELEKAVAEARRELVKKVRKAAKRYTSTLTDDLDPRAEALNQLATELEAAAAKGEPK